MKRIAILFVVISLCFICDRLTKDLAIIYLKGKGHISSFADMFRLQYAENSGAMLSMGEKLSDEMRHYVFVVAVALVLLVGFIYLVLKPLPTSRVVLGALVVGGGLGNLYDRVFHQGAVVDFINIGVGSLRTGIFNVADVAIMFGACGLLVHSFMNERRKIV